MKKSRELRKLYRILRKVKKHKEEMAALSDKELAGLTEQFKARLAAGETLDDLLPEAFAAVCEADWRILGKFPYDVQILGGIALHKGYLAEMNTGEGKTLTATMPLYLNALTERATLLVTANDYLAIRDAQEMGQVYNFMGLSIAAGVAMPGEKGFTNEEKQKIYAADIVYTTHGTLGFDYLFNNLVTRAEDRFLREFYYVIIDEADSVLLDAAQTPLVISGSPRVQSNLYDLADFFVTTLIKDRDYEVEEKKVWLTDEGIAYAEQFFQIDNFYSEKYFEINRHVTLALRAHVLFKMQKDYMISSKGELALLDNGSGRMMSGVKLRGGQHQALECKEKVKISQEMRSMASITYQNLFLLFDNMAGMSGTMADASDELREVYGKKVLVMPPNRPLLRKDLPDVFFQKEHDQVTEAMHLALSVHETGQPVLIVVSTIQQTEYVSRILIENGVPHNVLNANNAFWEADIIKEAGQMNAVTVSTSMAGRGTDIKLGEGVREVGGLAVIGIGRMANVRQERQARGRSGRQGDPGFSQFFVSLEDELVMNSNPPKVEKYLKKSHVRNGKLKKLINGAQTLGAEESEMSRKQAVSYDQVLKKQRELMYDMRDDLLDGGTLEESRVLALARKNIREFLKENPKLEIRTLNRYVLDHISYGLAEQQAELNLKRRKDVEAYLMQKVEEGLNRQRERLEEQHYMDTFLREATLQAIDAAWVEQVDYLQQLQSAVTGRSTAQRNPVFEYQTDALTSFHKMERAIRREIMRNVLLSNVDINEEQKLEILFP